jgi:hypothetical protein
MSDRMVFSLNTFWGRYLVFALVLIPFSLTSMLEENTDYPNPATAFLFHYFGCQLLFWALYVMVSLQFMMASKSEFSFFAYMSWVIFIFWLIGLSLIVVNIVSSIKTLSLDVLNHVSFGLAFLFAAYNLQRDKKAKSSGL